MGKQIYKTKWITIYTGFYKTRCTWGPGSYFDDRFTITIVPTLLIPLIGIWFTGFSLFSLIWLPFIFVGYCTFYIDLPIYSGIDESEPPQYGFYFYNEGSEIFFTSFWWNWNKKYYAFHMPWDWDWVRTSVLRKDGTWEHETKGNRKDFYKDKWDKIIWQEEYPYTYILQDGEIQQRIATVKVEEREWRWKGFKWSPYPQKIHRDISVNFSYNGPLNREVIIEKRNFKLKTKYCNEVGEQSGSWKGGCTGCGYKMLPNETPLQTLRRMEKERVFK